MAEKQTLGEMKNVDFRIPPSRCTFVQKLTWHLTEVLMRVEMKRDWVGKRLICESCGAVIFHIPQKKDLLWTELFSLLPTVPISLIIPCAMPFCSFVNLNIHIIQLKVIWTEQLDSLSQQLKGDCFRFSPASWLFLCGYFVDALHNLLSFIWVMNFLCKLQSWCWVINVGLSLSISVISDIMTLHQPPAL